MFRNTYSKVHFRLFCLFINQGIDQGHNRQLRPFEEPKITTKPLSTTVTVAYFCYFILIFSRLLS